MAVDISDPRKRDNNYRVGKYYGVFSRVFAEQLIDVRGVNRRDSITLSLLDCLPFAP